MCNVKIIVALKTIVAQKPLNFYIMAKNITWYKFNLSVPTNV